jgi:DNA-binding MarR family transcriptional regulator
MMGTDPSHGADEAALMVQYLKEMVDKILTPAAEQIHEYRQQLALQPGSGGHAGVNPNTIGRAARILRSHKTLTMGELSAALSVPLSTTTRMVDWLVATGQALRLPDPDDRRVVRVALTEAGLKMHDFIEARLSESARRTLQCLTEEERSTLLALLRKVASSKDSVLDDANDSIRSIGEKDS